MFRRFLTVLVIAGVVVPAAALAPREQATEAQPACGFTLGFATLREMILSQQGDHVGACLENEYFNIDNGNAEQRTTGGLMVWRKADNWTAFTNGSITWLNGPFGLATRPNEGPLFSWEAPPPSGGPVVPLPPAPGPAAPTATPVPPAASSAPTITLGLDEDRPRQGEQFTIRIEATDPEGIESVWWWATSTDDDDLRDTETRNCRGATPCRENWAVSTADEGDIIIHAQSRDTLGNLSEEVTREVRVRELEATTTPTSSPTPTRTPVP